MSDYKSDIIQLYTEILKESPDTITVGGREVSYEEMPNYTGFVNSMGKFVMSAEAVNHHDFRRDIATDNFYIDGYKKVRGKKAVKTNCSSVSEVKSLVRSATDYDSFRIWLSEDVISFWTKPAKEIFEGAINAISSLGDDPESYMYDCDVDGDFGMLNFDEFKNESMGGGEELSSKKAKLSQDKRLMADYLLRRRDGD